VSSNPTEKASTPSTKLPEALEPVRDRLRILLEGGSHEEVIELVVSCLIQLHNQNTELVLKLEQMRRERLGKRSEQLSSNQLSLLLELLGGTTDEEEQADRETTEAESQALTEDRAAADAANGTPPREKPRRRRPSKELPREVIVHELSEEDRSCDRCKKTMSEIGEDVHEIVELVPAHFAVHEHRRKKY
jgi:hypothetical protein